MTESSGSTGRRGVDERLRRRLLAGAVDDNVRAIENRPRGRLYRRPPVARWLLPGALFLGAVAVGAWVLFFRPPAPERVVFTPSTATGPASRLPDAPVFREPAPESAVEPLALPTRLDAHVFPLAVRRIVIDPGHGGSDEGTKTPNGLTEKILTLDIAQRLALQLMAAGYEVEMTRDSDEKLFLRDRIRFANEWRADLFVSIHVNWFKDGRANRGIETYYLGPSDDPFVTALASEENRESGYSRADVRKLLDGIYSGLRQQESQSLATAVQRELVATVRQVSRDVRDRGIRSAPFLVLVETQMPAILAEVASLSSPEEARLLAEESYRERIATALGDGIRAYPTVHDEADTKETTQ
ncbi:MAG: N-acetylmuramoyl-L-alanine amidase [Thermoanaerobaculia bacterium]